MKKKGFSFIDFGHALGRSEMKKLMAGSDGVCLHCFTPYGSECWYRDPVSTDPNGDCQSIYPGYEGVYGYNGECSGCKMS